MKRVALSKGKHALVSDEDYERVNQFKWYASLESRGTKWYAIRRETVGGKRIKVRMHRFIMGLGPGKFDDKVVDHLNHNSLDNQRENLEIISQEENMRRSPGWRKKGELCPKTDDEHFEPTKDRPVDWL